MGFFQKIIDTLQTRSAQVIDPSIFDHPVAMQVSRDPASRGGSTKNIAPHLVQQGNVAYYKRSPTLGGILTVFVFFPLLFLVFSSFDDGSFNIDDMWSIVPVFVFPLIMYLILYRTAIFGYYYCINGQSQMIYPLKNTKDLVKYDEKKMIRFDNVVALQIISERVRTKNSNYLSYELNLVLSDLSRKNLVDHSDYQSIVSDAEVISRLINIPVWDSVAGATVVADDLPKQIPTPINAHRDVVKDIPVENVSSGDDDLFS